MHSSILAKLKTVEETNFFGVYEAEPFEKTFGTTIGNAFRRVLLSSLPGVAVTSIRVKGVSHEFSTINGIQEDVLDFILNVKQLRIKQLQTFDKSVTLTLEVKGGPKAITGADIKCPPEVEIVNKDLHLANLTTPKSTLSVEFVVEEGRGYSTTKERHYSKKQAIDYIPIDALFTPIKKANFIVSPTRVGQYSDFDKVRFEVETDGTIAPLRAMNLAAAILMEHINLFVDEANYSPLLEVVAEEEVEGEDDDQLSKVPVGMTIEDLGLSTRVLNSLHAAEINTVEDLINCAEEDLMKLKNFGQKSQSEIKTRLKEHQLTLKIIE